MEQAEGTLHQDIAPVGTSNAEQTAQEKMLTQSTVNELIGKAKHAAYEKGRREALEVQTQQPNHMSGNMGGMPQLTEEQVRQMIADEAHRQTQVAAAHNMLSNFTQQMSAGNGKYPDFDETVKKLGELQNISHIVQLATETGIAGDVMYDLAKNPGKVASLTTLAYLNPDLAKVEMSKLADSIKTNESAKDSPEVAEPLSQVRPSTVGRDNGEYAVRDFRKKSWARA